jgi:hypothetical protein
MDAGDKVKLVKGSPLGKIGVIEFSTFMTRPADAKIGPLAMMKLPHEKCFAVSTGDGTYFFGFEDQLELIE